MNATADYYRRFAAIEAHGVSELYAEWARGVAADPELIARIETLPRQKRQANLVFAAARLAGCRLLPYSGVHGWLLENWPLIAELALSRSTQTNEAGRCAVLLPELATIEGPIALLEVGASAGIILYPDRYSYECESPEGPATLDPVDGPSTVSLSCFIGDHGDIPRAHAEHCLARRD